ncbi:MAG TPA: hypothetical protein VF171_02220 [Trueperaceae bacterium]
MNPFDLSGRTAIATGGTGIQGEAGLAAAGNKVGVLGRRSERATEGASESARQGGEAVALVAGVLEPARDQALAPRAGGVVVPVDGGFAAFAGV